METKHNLGENLSISQDGWLLSESSFSSKQNRKFEGLFCQGNGYLHLRGSLEETLSDAPQNLEYMRMPANVTAEKFPEMKSKYGTYVVGVYGQHPFLNMQLINLPYFITYKLQYQNKVFDLEKSDYTDYQRQLDLKSGLLTHSFYWTEAQLKVTCERFLSINQEPLCLQKMVLEPDEDISIKLSSLLDADVRTNGFNHFKEISLSHPSSSETRCKVTTNNNDEVVVQSALRNMQGVFEDTKSASTFLTELTLKAHQPYSIEKRSLVYNLKDFKNPDFNWEKSFSDLLSENNAVNEKRWQSCDIEVKGDPKVQATIRASQYHLIRTAPRQQTISIDAKGYAGEGYFGRFFWDSEVYLLPYFLYTDPAVAQKLVDFRIATLAGAKRNAEKLGYHGAKYAWESDNLGDESCPLWQYKDHEIHISADVLYAVLHLCAVKDDYSIFYDRAKEMVKEVARYWIERVDLKDGLPRLVGVMGPDEYQPLSSNNAYTNNMVKFVLGKALQFKDKIGFSTDEVAALENIVDNLPIPRREDGLVLQSDDFEKLAEPKFAERWLDRSQCYAAQVPQEVIYRSKNLKQADVLMLMYMFPDQFSEAELRQAYEYYEPLTTHDSSLSCAVHSILANKLADVEKAWRYFERGAYIDIDFAHGGPAEGIHIAAAAGNWLVIMHGFLGLQTKLTKKELILNPKLPQEITEIKANFVWDENLVEVVAKHEACTIKNNGTTPISAILRGQAKTIAPEERIEF